MKNNPIGIYDSGVGGLSVFKNLIKLLPSEKFIYYGDLKNLPYGEKNVSELFNIAVNIFDFFKEKKVKALIMACNTTSALIYEKIKNNYDFNIYPLIQLATKKIANENYKKIAIMATSATVNSHAYSHYLKFQNNNLNIYELACPQFVEIVENQSFDQQSSINIIKHHLHKVLYFNPDKIILGCTHYPFLLPYFKKYVSESLFLDPSIIFTKEVYLDLKNKNLINSQNNCPSTDFYISSKSDMFIRSCECFLSELKDYNYNFTHNLNCFEK